jgi:hypothetical protein
MGYWDNFVGGAQTPKKKSYWDSFESAPDQERANNTFRMQGEAIVAEKENQRVNSLGGQAKSFALDFGNRIVKIPVDFALETWNMGSERAGLIGETTSKVVNEIKSSTSKEGLRPDQRLKQAGDAIGEGMWKNAADLVLGITAPISAALTVALKQVGQDQIINDAGQVIADQTGITDIPAFQKYAMEHPDAGLNFERLLTLATLGIGIGGPKVGRGKIKTSEILAEADAVANKLVGQEPSGTRQLPVGGASREVPVDFANRYTPDAQLPTINAGPARKAPVERKGSLTYEPVSSPYWDSFGGAADELTIVPEPAPVRAPATRPQVAETAAERPKVMQDVPEGEAINTRAQKLLASAVERGIIDETGPIPTHQVKNMAEDLDNAFSLINRDRAIAEDIAMGETRSPSVEAGSVYKALEIDAIQKGDINTIMKLAKSELPTDAGRALKAFDSTDINSPVRIIRDINKSRTTKLEKRGEKTEVVRKREISEVKKEIKQAYSKRPTWEQFIDDLTCNI